MAGGDTRRFSNPKFVLGIRKEGDFFERTLRRALDWGMLFSCDRFRLDVIGVRGFFRLDVVGVRGFSGLSSELAVLIFIFYYFILL
mmetsp:Transcript_5841/g.8769  ORF Transcript_5841/g.8769 Transcript_5841/m.8769 type:complete len:86 (-) Transcript_5841:62-319(-)